MPAPAATGARRTRGPTALPLTEMSVWTSHPLQQTVLAQRAPDNHKPENLP